MTLQQANFNLEHGKATYPNHRFDEWEVEIDVKRDESGKETSREYIKKRLIRGGVRLTTEAALILNAASTGQPHGVLSQRYYEQEV